MLRQEPPSNARWACPKCRTVVVASSEHTCARCGHTAEPSQRTAIIPLAAPSRIHDVFAAIDAVRGWRYATGIYKPTSSTCTRAKAIVFAVGPLMDGGPERVTIAPSSKGGIVTTFFLPRRRDVTVAVMNNDDLLFLVGGRGGLDVQRVPLLEAATHAQRLVGRARVACSS